MTLSAHRCPIIHRLRTMLLSGVLWGLGVTVGHCAEVPEVKNATQPDAQTLDCIYQSMGRGKVFRAAGGPDPKGRYLIDLGAGNAQEGVWWSERGCQANEDGTFALIDPGANIDGVETAFLSLFDKSKRRVFFQTGFCQQPTLAADLHLLADQAVLACLQPPVNSLEASKP